MRILPISYMHLPGICQVLDTVLIHLNAIFLFNCSIFLTQRKLTNDEILMTLFK
jgi:hypothetical protein